MKKFDFIIIGAGTIGLFLASALRRKYANSKILIIEKEKQAGLHTSGRNSGVLHAGIYYEHKSLKAKVCQDGAKRLKEWILENSLPLNQCGKLIVPQDLDLDKQIDVLIQRAKSNNVDYSVWNEQEINKYFPEARSASGRGIWSPSTCVTNPKAVINHLVNELTDKDIEFKYGCCVQQIDMTGNSIYLSEEKLSFGHLFNCAGLFALNIAQLNGIGKNFRMIPFKGKYWQLSRDCPIKIPCNLYPVPDLSLPFLGIHFTPSAERTPTISIGPTATLALGKESYNKFEKIELLELSENLKTITSQYFKNNAGFRGYIHKQAPQIFKSVLLNQAKKLIPNLKDKYIEKSAKVGIRPQLYSLDSKSLIQDFVCIKSGNSTHVLNGISPAFTASFSLADLIILKSHL